MSLYTVFFGGILCTDVSSIHSSCYPAIKCNKLKILDQRKAIEGALRHCGTDENVGLG